MLSIFLWISVDEQNWPYIIIWTWKAEIYIDFFSYLERG